VEYSANNSHALHHALQTIPPLPNLQHCITHPPKVDEKDCIVHVCQELEVPKNRNLSRSPKLVSESMMGAQEQDSTFSTIVLNTLQKSTTDDHSALDTLQGHTIQMLPESLEHCQEQDQQRSLATPSELDVPEALPEPVDVASWVSNSIQSLMAFVSHKDTP
jgi:hypothetical protein